MDRDLVQPKNKHSALGMLNMIEFQKLMSNQKIAA